MHINYFFLIAKTIVNINLMCGCSLTQVKYTITCLNAHAHWTRGKLSKHDDV